MQSKQTDHSSAREHASPSAGRSLIRASSLRDAPGSKGHFPCAVFSRSFPTGSRVAQAGPELLLFLLYLLSARMTGTQYTSIRATDMSSIVPSNSLCSADMVEAPLVSVCSKLLILIFLYYLLSCDGGTWGSRLVSSCRQFGRRSHHSRVFPLSGHSLLPLLLLTLAYKVLGFTLAFSNKIGF